MGFTFGDNWLRFSDTLNEARLEEAQASLHRLAGPDQLLGRSFVDIGAGSGLFAIAAVRSGATRVVALDRDDQCIRAIDLNATRFLTADQRRALQIRSGDVLRPE